MLQKQKGKALHVNNLMIKFENEKWNLYSPNGKTVLGSYETYEQAEMVQTLTDRYAYGKRIRLDKQIPAPFQHKIS